MKGKNLMGASIFSAIAAALCCITPVFAMLAGIGGIAATFSWIEPYRPYLIALTIFVLGFAWYQMLKPKGDINCVCDDENLSFWQGKPFLGLITVFAIMMMAFPLYSAIFYGSMVKDAGESFVKTMDAQRTGRYQNVVMVVDGMTCTGCQRFIEDAVSKLDGVTGVKASFRDGQARITFDKNKTDEREIRKTIDSTGYRVK